MDLPFLIRYLDAFHTIEGWFSFDAAIMFMAYNQLVAADGIAGNVLEIGVHRGLSSIALATLRGKPGAFYAVDLFENLQAQNVSASGSGNKALFVANMARFYAAADFVRIIERSSMDLTPADLGLAQFSFCHIDGGHSARETYHDIDLCSQITMPGGLIALDDYFNPLYPGVCEGAIEFMLSHKDALQPVAAGFNKVLFQRMPAPCDLNAAFSGLFPEVPHATTQLWGRPAFLFGAEALRSSFDLLESTPSHLVTRPESPNRVTFEPAPAQLKGRCGQTRPISVGVTNQSLKPLPYGERVFGLSYHLLSLDKTLLVHDNERAYFDRPVEPNRHIEVSIPVRLPEKPGSYWIELDLVWENVMWFRDTGNPTRLLELTVAPRWLR